MAKINPSPLQYFSTPLPMAMYEFERFLKNNHLDVQSVTTPLILPQLRSPPAKDEAYASNRNNKIQLNPTTNMVVNIDKADAILSEDNKNKLVNDALKGLHVTAKGVYKTATHNLNNDYEYIDDNRRKRFNESPEYVTNGLAKKKAKSIKFKKNFNFFQDKKISTDPIDILHALPLGKASNDSDLQDAVEVTIINMNDMNDTSPVSKILYRPVKMFERDYMAKPTLITPKIRVHTVTISGVKAGVTPCTMSPFIKRMHNHLLYHNNSYNDYVTTTDGKTREMFHHTTLAENQDDFLKNSFRADIDHNPFNKLHAKHPPKRVKISGHSYKYDIVYNHEPQRLKKNDIHHCKYYFHSK